ncbi:Tryptophan--tRNA ligase, mitochondrial [Coemansia sp. RSA 988]|nr:Tryptophan--tRNA ligase, mitochondrial [Coemansia sp. RSA 988]
MGMFSEVMLPAPNGAVMSIANDSQTGAEKSQQLSQSSNVFSLYHIPQTLSTFTVEYLSKLFSAVEKPHTVLKRPDRPIDERKFPEFRYFIRTLLINGRISADTLVHALIYLSRFHRRVSRQRALVEEGAKHKLFLAALLVASKFCDDRWPLATVVVCDFLPSGLLSFAEVNRIERAFLKVIGYKLIVDPNELALLLGKHGIDIRQIAYTIAERLGTNNKQLDCHRLTQSDTQKPSSITYRAVAAFVRSSEAMASTIRVFSGIQPTGVPQLGNYLGSIRNWVALQTQQLQQGNTTPHEQFISIVDLHALTVPRDPERLRNETIETAASLIACGIDPSRSVLFRQSAVPAHTQLHWALSCITPVGWLNRMTQWKSKLQQQTQDITLDQTAESALNVRSAAAQHLLTGLFTYPVLMAADILLYRATHIPVGEDQIQHLEFARDLLVHFNKTYKTKFFPMPTALLTDSRRVMSLRDPLRKMSKSDPNEQSRITLADTDDQIVRKIRKAPTDAIRGITFDPESRPGVSNLLSIYAALCATSPVAAADEMSRFTNVQLKDTVAEAVIYSLSPIRLQMLRLLEDRGHVESILRNNENKAREVAEKNWKSIAECIGLSH